MNPHKHLAVSFKVSRRVMIFKLNFRSNSTTYCVTVFVTLFAELKPIITYVTAYTYLLLILTFELING